MSIEVRNCATVDDVNIELAKNGAHFWARIHYVIEINSLLQHAQPQTVKAYSHPRRHRSGKRYRHRVKHAVR